MSALLQPDLRRDPAAAPGTHAQALQQWQRAEDIAAWAGRHFRFDAERALQFSSTRRREGPLPSVAEPANFSSCPRASAWTWRGWRWKRCATWTRRRRRTT